MTTATISITAAGTTTWTAPATLLNGGIAAEVFGGPSDNGSLGTGFGGAEISGGITLAPSTTLTVVIGYHNGGTGGSGGFQGGPSAAILQSGTLMMEAGGAGGAGVFGPSANPGGAGGNHAGNGGGPGGGFGANGATPGAAGAGSGGSAGTLGGGSGTTDGGTSTNGGGGGGGYAGGGGGSAGYGGGGGSSFVNSGVVFGLITAGASTAFASARITYTVADAPKAPTLVGPANNSYQELETVGPSFSFVYNPGTDSGLLANWAMRRQVSGGAGTVTVSGGSVGTNVSTFSGGGGTLTYSGTATNWDTSGLVVVPTSGGTAVLSYTGLTGSTLTGVKLVSGTGTMLSTANGVSRTAGYEYYNATSGHWNNATPVQNASSVSGMVFTSPHTWTYTFGTGAWQDGCVYNWNIETQENHYDLQGPWATSDFTVTAAAIPVTTIVAPSSVSGTATPNVTWTFTGSTQTSYRVVYYTPAQTGAFGFLPGITPGVYDSGTVSSAATTFATPSAAGLSNGQTYDIYLQVAETGGLLSAWSNVTTTIEFPAPASPQLTATAANDPNTGEPMVNLVATLNENMLSADDSSFETTIGTWIAITNGHTPVRTGSVSLSGNEALQLEATSSGNVVYGTANGTGGYAVNPGQTYAAIAAILTAATSRSCELAINWYQASGSASAITPQTLGNAETDNTLGGGGWVRMAAMGAAPSDAAFAQVRVLVGSAAASEIHYLDEVGLFATASAASIPVWALGGYDANHANSNVEMQYSDDGGNTWADLRFGALLDIDDTVQVVGCSDYEMGCGVYPSYNMLSAADADLELGAGTWFTNANLGGATATFSNAFAFTGTRSLKVTAAGGSPALSAVQGINVGFVDPLLPGGYDIGAVPELPLGSEACINPVTAGAVYIARAAVRAAPGSPASTVALGLVWYDPDGQQIGNPTYGTAVTMPTNGFVQLTTQAQAPTLAAGVAIVVTWTATTGNLSTGTAMYIDTVSLGYNPVYPQAPIFPANWTPGFDPTASPQPPWSMTQRLYQARTIDFTNPNAPAPSPWSNVAEATPQPTTNAHWYISDPTVQGSGVQFDMNTDWRPTIHEETTLYFPVGRDHAIKSGTGSKGLGGQVDALVTTSQQFNMLLAVLENPNTLMLQTPFRRFYILLNNQDRIGDGVYQTMARSDYAVIRQTFYCAEADMP